MNNNDSEITFRYFAEPHRFSTYVAAPRRCDICGEMRPGYSDAYFTDPAGPDIRFVCEPDLRGGRLAQARAQVNTADRDSAREQITRLRPDWDAAKIDVYIAQITREVEVCTPSVTTWQDYDWPAHCGDYMQFVKEIGQEDCDRLGEGDGYGFFEKSIEPSYRKGDDESEVNSTLGELWERMRPDAPVDNSDPTSTSFYLFKCLSCGSSLIEWDTDDGSPGNEIPVTFEGG